jgi:hypothetical protein
MRATVSLVIATFLSLESSALLFHGEGGPYIDTGPVDGEIYRLQIRDYLSKGPTLFLYGKLNNGYDAVCLITKNVARNQGTDLISLGRELVNNTAKISCYGTLDPKVSRWNGMFATSYKLEKATP